jgi:hypothetical protein
VAGVDVVAHEHETAVVVLERLRVQEVDLAGGDAVARRLELEERRPGLVAGRGEDPVREMFATPLATRL